MTVVLKNNNTNYNIPFELQTQFEDDCNNNINIKEKYGEYNLLK